MHQVARCDIGQEYSLHIIQAYKLLDSVCCEPSIYVLMYYYITYGFSDPSIHVLMCYYVTYKCEHFVALLNKD